MGEGGLNVGWAGVPREELLNFIPLVSHHIQAAMDTTLGERSLEEIVEKLLEGNMQMWVIGDEDDLQILGVLLTQIKTLKNMKLLNVYLCSGEALDDWTVHLETLEEWGRSEGCDFITAHGRRGWKKKLAPFGWKEKYITLYKPLFRSH